MPSKSTKPASRSATQPPAPAPPQPKRKDERKAIVKSIKVTLGKLEAAQIDEDETEASPSPLDEFLSRLAKKSPEAFDYHLLSQALVPWWSDWHVQEIEIKTEDLTPSVVEALVNLFRVALRKGFGVGVYGDDELALEDLRAMEEWVDKIWEAVEMIAEKPASAEPSSHLASPELSRGSIVPAPRPKKQATTTTKPKSKKDAPLTYRATPAPNDPSPELFGAPPTPAQSGAESQRAPASKTEPSVASVEIPVKAKNGGSKGVPVKRKAEEQLVELEAEEENGSARRRSGRHPSHRAPSDAAIRRSYPLYSILMVTLADGGTMVQWPAAVIDESDGEGRKTHGERHEGDYLVQLLPTRKQLWIPPENMSHLPSKLKLEVPASITKGKRIANYKTAIALLKNDLALDQWLNGSSAQDALSSKVQEPDHDGRESAEVKVGRSAKRSKRG